MKLVDFHCHLDAEDFNKTRFDIVKQCFAFGFIHLVLVADPYVESSHGLTTDLAAADKRIFCMTAAHPHNADDYTPAIEQKIVEFSQAKNVLAIGEAGLDFYYGYSARENQIKVFQRQIALAQEMGLPLVIHSRKAESEVLAELEVAKFDQSVVFHCYTGTIEDAREILKRGYYISISGIVTFKKADFIREITKIIPLNRIFTETDSPYLSPEPFRGKVNSPMNVKYVAEKIAELKDITVEELNKAVAQNLIKLKAT